MIRVNAPMSASEKNAPENRVSADVAGLAAAVERIAADLAIAEEPSGFVLALEGESPAEPRD
jgi:hypothetical protein